MWRITHPGCLTSDRPPGHAYTNWLLVWNFPELCIDPQPERDYACGPDDFLNVAAGFSLMWGTGAVTESTTHTFEGTREAFDPDGVLVGPGLVRPEGAEVHIIVRDHGPASGDPEVREDQTTTVDGGCNNGMLHPLEVWGAPGDYECRDPQATG